MIVHRANEQGKDEAILHACSIFLILGICSYSYFIIFYLMLESHKFILKIKDSH
jgi:hypothetical protein